MPKGWTHPERGSPSTMKVPLGPEARLARFYRIGRQGKVEQVANIAGFCPSGSRTRRDKRSSWAIRHPCVATNGPQHAGFCRRSSRWVNDGFGRRTFRPRRGWQPVLLGLRRVEPGMQRLHLSAAQRWHSRVLRRALCVCERDGVQCYGRCAVYRREPARLRDAAAAFAATERRASPEVYASGLARAPDGVVLDAAQTLYVTCYATDCIYRIRTIAPSSFSYTSLRGRYLQDPPTQLSLGGGGANGPFGSQPGPLAHHTNSHRHTRSTARDRQLAE